MRAVLYPDEDGAYQPAELPAVHYFPLRLHRAAADVYHSHISRLHRLINPKIRSLSSSVNMMTGRLLTSVMLMAPKFLLEHEAGTAGIRVIDIFWIYAIVFIPVGLYFIYKIYRYNVRAEHSLMNVSAAKA